MKNNFHTLAATDRRSRSPMAALLATIFLLVFTMQASAQAPAAPSGMAPPPSSAQVDNLIGPIALYPDDLVAIILPASTNPLQLVQADRFLDKRKADPKLAVDDRWDDSVKSLLNYPDVVKKMSADLDWTSALGEAVVADQGAVLEGIQSFRRRAQAAGNLKSDDKQVVKAEQETIVIVPADPQVIYVPQYTPSTVVTYGVAPVYGYYPTAYPSYYYPYAPGAALAAGVIWGAAIGAAWSGNHYGANYGGNANINVNRNTNINTGNTNINRSGASAQARGSSSAWKSNKQPGQVSNSVGKTNTGARAGDARAGAGGAGSMGGGARPSTQPAGGVGGNRDGASGSGSFGNSGSGRQTQMDSSRGASSRNGASGGGFGDYGSGRQTQMDSSRGASSRNSMSGSSARQTSGGGGFSGGGGRSGGGGGRR